MGFDLIGVAPAARAPHADAYVAWVDAGYAATMGYMARDLARRQDPRQVLPGARSAVVVGLSYFVADPPADLWNDPSRGRIARYAWGLDYHDVMTPRLRQLAEFIAGEAGRETNYRVYVDTGPVLERDLAARAGLGFTGKNTCLISPALGSYLFLGEILTDLDLDFDSAPSQSLASDGGEAFPSPVLTGEGQGGGGLVARISKRTLTLSAPEVLGGRGQGVRSGTCGACTRCLVACPTHAFPAPYVLDSNRCISYLTIELKGSIPPDLRPLMGNWIFGCDVCQAVCPWPRRFARPARDPFLRFDPERAIPKLLDLITLTGDGFRARFAGSPILRAKRRGLLRNVAVALGNWGDARAIPFLRLALDDPEPLVREHAAWALDQIG